MMLNNQKITSDDNKEINNHYGIYLLKELGGYLAVDVGNLVEIIINTEHSNQQNKSNSFVVLGFYEDDSTYFKSYILPILSLSDYGEFDESFISFHMQLYRASDILDVLPKLKKAKLNPYVWSVLEEEINLVNASRFILIVVSVFTIIVAFLILNNILTITINSRINFISRLKLLGATSTEISNSYFISFLLSFTLSFLLALALNFLLIGFYEGMINKLLEFTISINNSLYAYLIASAASFLTLLWRYFRFRLKITRITPLDFMREE